jgi:hypothetical protein
LSDTTTLICKNANIKYAHELERFKLDPFELNSIFGNSCGLLPRHQLCGTPKARRMISHPPSLTLNSLFIDAFPQKKKTDIHEGKAELQMITDTNQWHFLQKTNQ